MTTPPEIFSATRTAAGGGWSTASRPSLPTTVALLLAAVLALPVAILLVTLVIALVLILAILMSLRRLWDSILAGFGRRSRGTDGEGRVNVRVRRPES